LARINVEDSIYKDARFLQLVVRLGDADRALGVVVRAWTVAQKWYTREPRMVPVAEWDKQNFPSDLVEVGLAERVGEFVRMAGADDQFAWLIQCQVAGSKGGKARAKNARQANEAGAKRELSLRKRELSLRKPLTLSLSLNTKKPERENAELALTPENLAKGKSIWSETLAHFGIKRGVSLLEETKIARAIQAMGPELVHDALVGVRFDGDENFDRSKQLKLDSILDPKKIEAHANRAIKALAASRRVFVPEGEG